MWERVRERVGETMRERECGRESVLERVCESVW